MNCKFSQTRLVRFLGAIQLLLLCFTMIHSAQAEDLSIGPKQSETVIDCKKNKLYSKGFDRISILSVRKGSKWIRPENIVIRNCDIRGTVQIWGIGPHNTPAGLDLLRKASLRPDFTINARRSAPTGIRFVNCRFHLTRATGIYVGVGVTFLTVRNSKFLYYPNSVKKDSYNPVIYLDHESGMNSFIKNEFQIEDNRKDGTSTRRREIIAIDGSSDNLITGNQFIGLQWGGIFLYRNCGERGVVRHTLPVNNKIMNNIFHVVDSDRPAIVFGSRAVHEYCELDKEGIFGSSLSNESYVINNYAYNNSICKTGTIRDRTKWIGSHHKGFDNRTFDNTIEQTNWLDARDTECTLSQKQN